MYVIKKMEYKLFRKKKSFDIVNLMGGNRIKNVPEHNPKQHSPQGQKDPPPPSE